MSAKTDLLLARLAAIGAALAAHDGLAVIGLGSVGIERSRLDDYSDLDFFAIVRPGTKAYFLTDLTWLSTPCPIAYVFQNSIDGFKLLYTDDVFCELAVFEPDELAHIPFAPGQIVWQHPDFDAASAVPAPPAPRHPLERTVEWALGEALTNLYVGLLRYQRGEKLAAQRFIEHFALDRLLELSARVETPTNALPDQYTVMRRYEARFPVTAAHLATFIQGYARVPASARAILAWLEAHFEVNPAIAARISALCADA